MAKSNSRTWPSPLRDSAQPGRLPPRGWPLGLSQTPVPANCGMPSCAPPTITPSRAFCSLDRINQDNNLNYCETIAATTLRRTAPAPYGCCCLGSVDLTRFVREAFEGDASFDFTAFESLVATTIRMLDNVLDVTEWLLPQQQAEVAAKRRVGLGFTGLGDALAMLGLKYDTEEARDMATKISASMRDAVYRASVHRPRSAVRFLIQRRFVFGRWFRIAPARGDPERHPRAWHSQLASFVHRTDRHDFACLCRQRVQRHRATVQLVLHAQEAHARRHPRRIRVEDHAWRTFRHLKGNDAPLSTRVRHCAGNLGQRAHADGRAVAPYIDTSIPRP